MRRVANHVIGGAERYAVYLTRGSGEAAAATREKDYCGHAPSRVSQELEKRFIDSWTFVDASQLFPHPAEPVTRDELLRMRALECLLHAWDLEHGLGRRPALPEGLCQGVVEECESTLRRMAGHGSYRPLPVVDTAPASTVLLAMAGRQPWAPSP